MGRMKNYTVIVALGLLLVGCTPTPAPDAAPTVETIATPTPTPTPTVEAERGTRQNPLAVGEGRKISEVSAWTVGASAATEVGDGYVVLPLSLGIDWEAAIAQAEKQGEPWDPDNEGMDPYGSLSIGFVTADGRSYTTMDDYSVTIPDTFSRVGTIFPPADQLNVNHAVSVPADQVEGGAWVIRNGAGDTVFIATK